MYENIAIVIPAYCPDRKIIDLCADLSSFFNWIIVVNDGNDRSYDEIFNHVSNNADVIRHYVNCGKGRSIKSAINYLLCEKENRSYNIRGIITVDADGQHLVEDILHIANKMQEQEFSSIVLGTRNFKTNGIPLRSKFGNILTSKVFHFLCGQKISDTQTGLRGIPEQFLEKCLNISGERYEYETNMLIEFSKMCSIFTEVSITTIYENNNSSSHFNPLLDSIKIYACILKYSLSSLISWVIDYSVFNIVLALGGNVFIGNYIGRAISAYVNYNTNRKVVFKTDNGVKSVIQYIILVILSGTVSAILINVLSLFSHINVRILKIIVEVILFFFNYYFQNTIIFKKSQT